MHPRAVTHPWVKNHSMRTLTLILATFFFALTSPLPAVAQTAITGQIIDAESKEPLLFASVSLFQEKVLKKGVITDIAGKFSIHGIDPGTYSIEVAYTGYSMKRWDDIVAKAGAMTTVNLALSNKGGVMLSEIAVVAYKKPLYEKDQSSSGSITTSEEIRNLPTRNVNSLVATTAGLGSSREGKQNRRSRNDQAPVTIRGSRSNATNYYIDGVRVQGKLIPETERHSNSDPTAGEQYNAIVENNFIQTWERATHTFSSDVDAASYSLLRSTLNANNLPDPDAVRIEEMINYFNYDLSAPTGEAPLAATTELAPCPWNPAHRLLQIGMRARGLSTTTLPPANFVFLIDASGSMGSADKLPLLVESFKLLIDNLGAADRVSIVTYAGAAGLVLPPTSGSDKAKIRQALDRLHSGGFTAGGAGIQLAYKTAREQFITGGNNRIILATDGDFNVGVSSQEELVKLIEKERESGIYLSVLGFGRGNLQDGTMQELADRGNGNHAYIDRLEEAKKVLVSEMGGTLYTAAKDVKIQVYFNPRIVGAYRLIGYENRLLANEDFEDDTKDAGDLGSGPHRSCPL